MVRVNQLLQECDFFGAIFRPSANTMFKEYKTNFGGVISLLIFILSFGYLVYNIIIWQMGLFLPTTITSKQTLSEGNYVIEENSLSIICSNSDFNIDVFNTSNMILQPVVQIIIKGEPKYQLNYIVQQDSFTQLHQIIIPELNYTINFMKEYEPSTKYLIQLQACNKIRASKLNQTCASQNEINQFLKNSTKFVTLRFNLRQFNEQKKSIDQFKYQNMFLLDNQTLQYSQAQIMLQEAIIDDGFLFPNKQSLIFNENIDLVNQQISNNQVSEIVNDNTPFYLTLKLYPLKTVKYIQYLKINELLASAGSIIQIIFYISVIAQFYNSRKFDYHIKEKVISFFYPQFQNLKITRSLTGKIIQVYQDDKQVCLNQFQLFYDKVQTIAEQKLTFLNIIYEISRLQFIYMYYFKSRKILQDSHTQGINLPEFSIQQESKLVNLNKIEPKSDLISIIESPSKPSNQEFYFQEEDFDILIKPSQPIQ